ncbi:MAG TPA: GIDE domain-containing protein [Labilithrix sp.]|nr:GIDE domain-containing protein [Labilithrix sp.]
MQYLGFVLVFLALIALVIGLLQHLKGKKILAAPFRKTGEIAANPAVADAKGIVSCEGRVEAQQPAIAPCSGKPCVYFEIEVIQEWTKHVVTEDGHKTEKGKDTIQTVKTGAVFFVNDGSGPVAVDPREGMTVELDKSFEQTQNVSHGDVMFGQFHAHIPHASGDKHGSGVKIVEKIVPIDGGMFVMGQLANQAITKPKGMLGSLLGSRKGRNALLGATKRNKIIGFVAGGVCLLPGAGLSIFADAPAPTAAGEGACNILDESKANQPCTGKIYNDDGSNVELTVTQAGTFDIQGGPPRGKKIPVIASIGVKAADGKVILADAHETASVDLQPGKYSVNIKDSIPGDAAHFKGGFSFELLVKRTALLGSEAGAPVASALGSAAPSASVAALPGKPAIKAAGAAIKPATATSAKPAAPAGAKPAGKK